ncbi:LL-diaminopimelate aminotransferase [Fundicoccus culcitae]|uniref:Aminotransferase n=1 Tax=Fundicoccus culcitae TaxID=2969821 RepID=A0ABY5P9K8_9LACT|nr:LL-diaminopimelate aminotransferase [Fundicoccus culcitae]UUX35040.1 LL-diaminopimelate aminotransferase [Fundicoccus culcitae]
MTIELNQNYAKLPDSYLFSTINKKIASFQKEYPKADIIRLGIGDVVLPLVPGVIEALHEAVDEQAVRETFRGYGPEGGYDFLRQAIAEVEFQTNGINIQLDEVFISDGSKSDVANIQELFGQKISVAIGDPVYPVYIDSNVLSGRLGDFEAVTGKWSEAIYLVGNETNRFVPELPAKKADLIYLCYPNNPTGMTLTKDQLQLWVDYANDQGNVIIFDAAYEAYIQEDGIPHSIYECSGAQTCAIEMRSFSKKAGFTGLRLGYTVIPKALQINGQSLNKMWLRRQSTKFNGAPYIVQKAGAATLQEPAKSQIADNIQYYMENARIIREGLEASGITVFGGVNAPYLWMKVPNGLSSWEFFDQLLTRAQVVGTPGVGFGPSGEGYFRLTAFNIHEQTLAAVERIQSFLAVGLG